MIVNLASALFRKDNKHLFKAKNFSVNKAGELSQP
jgi:hypothetical protein